MTHFFLGHRPTFITTNLLEGDVLKAARRGTMCVNGENVEIQDLSGEPIMPQYRARKADKSSGKVVHLPNEGPKYRR